MALALVGALAVCVVAGVWTYLALTGQVASESGSMNVYSNSVTIPAIVEMLSFLAGLVLLALFGALALTGGKAAPSDDPASCEIVAPAYGECTVPAP